MTRVQFLKGCTSGSVAPGTDVISNKDVVEDGMVVPTVTTEPGVQVGFVKEA